MTYQFIDNLTRVELWYNIKYMPKYLNVPKLYRSKEWLSQKYIQEMLSSRAIAEIVGCERKTIDQWLKKVDIKKRGFGGSKGKKPKKWLVNEYIIKGKSLHDLAVELNEDRKTIHRWLMGYEIPRHPVGDNRKGKDSPLWRGGKYDYKTNPDGYKEYKVRRGKMLIWEHRKVMEQFLGRRLTKIERFHHINLDRTDNRIENLYLFPNQNKHQKYHHLYRKRLTGLLNSNLIKEH